MAGMTGLCSGIEYSLLHEYSVYSAKCDSLSCSNFLSDFSRAGPDNSKRQVCMASILVTYSG